MLKDLKLEDLKLEEIMSEVERRYGRELPDPIECTAEEFQEINELITAVIGEIAPKAESVFNELTNELADEMVAGTAVALLECVREHVESLIPQYPALNSKTTKAIADTEFLTIDITFPYGTPLIKIPLESFLAKIKECESIGGAVEDVLNLAVERHAPASAPTVEKMNQEELAKFIKKVTPIHKDGGDVEEGDISSKNISYNFPME